MPSVAQVSRPSAFTSEIIAQSLRQVAVLHIAPGRAHAEALRAALLGARAACVATSAGSISFDAASPVSKCADWLQ